MDRPGDTVSSVEITVGFDFGFGFGFGSSPLNSLALWRLAAGGLGQPASPFNNGTLIDSKFSWHLPLCVAKIN
jgi:hypothetical protein